MIQKWSQIFLVTKKDAPSDAEIASHQLMMRAGLLKKTAPGIFTYGFLALKAIRKFENIIRNELEAIGGQEILMPMVQPKELWQETKRWNEMGELLLKFQNRNEHWYCLGGTHEEVITDFVRNELQSYKQLPQLIYQIQTKYRDEIRPRFGLMRGREFIMKDAYSFDENQDAAIQSYNRLYKAYENIFAALGLDFRVVEADAGNIGGSLTHEFQILAESGEDQLLVCDQCDYASNVEVTPVTKIEAEAYDGKQEGKEKEKFKTPGLKTIEDLANSLGLKERHLVKSLFYQDEEGKAYLVLSRGDDTLNPVKLKNVLGLANSPEMLSEDKIKEITGAGPGSCGPLGLDLDIYIDQSLKDYKNFIVGANEDNHHLKNVNFSDFKHEGFYDLRLASKGDNCPKCEGKLLLKRGIEVGHCFYLGTKYSKAMEANFLDQNGKSRPLEMGCYGIGVGRTIQAAIEQSHDKDGIIWPKSISPFDIHICLLDPADEEIASTCENLASELSKLGYSIFIDDRKERPGVKFKDADLLGFPLRITLGAKSLKAGKIELVDRKAKEKKELPLESAVSNISNITGI